MESNGYTQSKILAKKYGKPINERLKELVNDDVSQVGVIAPTT